jgi:hypothetical protein
VPRDRVEAERGGEPGEEEVVARVPCVEREEDEEDRDDEAGPEEEDEALVAVRLLARETVEARDDGRSAEDGAVPFPVPDAQDELARPGRIDAVGRERVEAGDEVGGVGGGGELPEAADPHAVEPGLVDVANSGRAEGERLTDERGEVEEDPVPADPLPSRLVLHRVGGAEVEPVDPGDPVGRVAVGRAPAGREDERKARRVRGWAARAASAIGPSATSAATRATGARRARLRGPGIVR